MLEAYFDSDFIVRLSERKDRNDEIIYDFVHFFLKRVRGISIIIDGLTYTDFLGLSTSEKESNEIVIYLFEISSNIKFINFKSDLSKVDFYKQGSAFKVFFIERKDCELLTKQFGYLFINNANLAKEWKPFTLNREDNELTIRTEKAGNEYFDNWDKLFNYKHPINGILIFDKYILMDKSYHRIKDNLIPCLKNLISFSPEQNKIQLLIISEKILENERGITPNEKLEKVIRTISTEIKNLEISIMWYLENKIKSDSEHNRVLFSNYYMISTEAGFNIFKDPTMKKVNNRDTITFRNIFKNSNRNIMRNALENLSEYCSNIHTSEGKEYYNRETFIDNFRYYYPSKENRLLNF